MIHHLAEVSSTNDSLRTLAEQGTPAGAAVVADHQRQGRGRLGRSWWSDTDNLAMSGLLRPGSDRRALSLLTLAVAAALREVLGPPWRIKWPNDILHPDGRKLAGVLSELEWRNGEPAYAIVGIGLNIGSAPPDLPAVALVDVFDRVHRL